MTQLDLLKAIGYAQDVHILDAEEMPQKGSPVPFRKPVVTALAAILAIVLAVGLFLQTPVGAAAAVVIREQVTRFLEILFPPREETIFVEGIEEIVQLEAQGRDPQAHSPGFSIYVDKDSYTMVREGDSWFIRPVPMELSREDIRAQEAEYLKDMTQEEQETVIDERLKELEAFYKALPPVEVEIREILDQQPMDVAQEVHTQMTGYWTDLTGIYETGRDGGGQVCSFDAGQGLSWDSAQESHRFWNNGQGGCFHIATRYYLEASEGHGTRLTQMVNSFTLVAPQDTSPSSTVKEALVKAMYQEIAYAQEQEERILADLEQNVSQADMNGAAYERNALWQEIHSKMWSALEQTLDPSTMDDLMAEHLQWSAQKRIDIELLQAKLGGGSLTGTVVEGENAKRTKERVMTLLNYLEGTASPPVRSPGLVLSPNAMVEEIAEAYFSADHETIQTYLSDSYMGVVEVHSRGTETVNAIKGLDNIPENMARFGCLYPSVEYRETQDSDSYMYLSMTLIWENEHWAIAFYGLEG